MSVLPALSFTSVVSVGSDRSERRNNGVMTMGVSTDAIGRNGVQSLAFGQRLATALRQCLGLGEPGGLPPKQLAFDVGVDVKTVYSWMAGNGIRGEHLVRLFAIMPASFANIVLGDTGCTVVKLEDTRRAYQKAAAEHAHVMALLAAGGGAD